LTEHNAAVMTVFLILAGNVIAIGLPPLGS
jgi:hypothetical protein